jgi:serine/threonine protein kinase
MRSLANYSLPDTEIEDLTFSQPVQQGGDNYRLIELRGSGAFGQVWKAQNLGTGQIVALKIVNVNDPKIAELIVEEVRILKQISQPRCHPFLSCFYDYVYDQRNRQIFIEMEYIDGQELQNWSQQFSFEDLYYKLLLVTADISRALQFIHSRNVVHRDIKPSNILITYENVPKLVDFGLGCNPQMCSTSYCCPGNPGTPHFMAPETLAFGESYFASDVWSLGVTLFFIATGRYPFDFHSTSILEIKETIIHTMPAKLNTSMPQLNQIVNGCLVKDPNYRITLEQIMSILRA